MLKYPCLVLDHDDTVVQSEKTIGYPFFCTILEEFRPGSTVTLEEFAQDCYSLGFAQMCRQRWNFSEEELVEEYLGWKEYVRTHVPAAYPGIGNLIRRQKEAGGLVCVVSHSSVDNITRDYDVHFGVQPDAIYGWDYPEELRKPNPFPLQDIMKRYHLSPDELLVVDDMKLAWNMANPLGVKVAFAGWGRLDFPELYSEMRKICDFSFDKAEDLEAFLFP